MNSPTFRELLSVAFGGAIGSSARWGINVWVAARFGAGLAWPWATFGINVLGSFCIGLVAGLAAAGAFGITPALRLFLAVGVLGGFTTFSSFSLEMLNAAEAGKAWIAAAYGVSSVLLGFSAAAGGVALARSIR